MSILLKNKIIDKLDSIVWSTESAESNSDMAYNAIITAISDYIKNEYTFNGTYIGIHATTPSPTPITGSSTNSIHVTDTTWLDIYKTTIRNGISSNGIIRMFSAIQTMLTGTILASITTLTPPLTTTVPPLNTPIVPVLFPSIISFGTICQTEIFNKKPNNKEDTWEIISKYIQQGLNLNVVPPMMFGGTLVSGVTGTVTTLLVFN
jgi:hypothetical protein